jgi:low affinity Fe/Cu permease
MGLCSTGIMARRKRQRKHVGIRKYFAVFLGSMVASGIVTLLAMGFLAIFLWIMGILFPHSDSLLVQIINDIAGIGFLAWFLIFNVITIYLTLREVKEL